MIFLSSRILIFFGNHYLVTWHKNIKQDGPFLFCAKICDGIPIDAATKNTLVLFWRFSVTLEKMILKSQCKYFKLLFNHLIQHNWCGLHSWGYPLFSLFDTFFSLRLFIYHSFIFLVVYTCLLVVVEIET